MKIKFSYILKSLILMGASLYSFASLAQEEGLPSYELQDANNQELNINNEDKTLIYEDSKSSKNTPSESHQNTPTAPAKVKNSDSNKSSSNSVNTKEGEDALSFNFLYYIIQKYKSSDIIDQ